MRPLSRAEQSSLESHLEAGERLLWYVRPKLLPGKQTLLSLILIPLANWALAGVFCLLILGGPDVDPVAWCLCPFVVTIAAIVTLGLFWRCLNQITAFYAVTNQRALVIKPPLPFFGRRVSQYPLASNMVVEIVENRDGSGDVVLAYENVSPDALGRRPTLGFLRVPAVQSVASALESVSASFPPRNDAEHSRYLSWADPRNCLSKPDTFLRNIGVVMMLLGAGVFYGSTFLLEKPVDYFLHAERTVGVEVAAEKHADGNYIPLYEYKLADGRVYRQRVDCGGYPEAHIPGRQVIILYFPDAPEEAMALWPQQMFGLGAFLGLWGLLFIGGGAGVFSAYKQNLRKYRSITEV